MIRYFFLMLGSCTVLACEFHEKKQQSRYLQEIQVQAMVHNILQQSKALPSSGSVRAQVTSRIHNSNQVKKIV